MGQASLGIEIKEGDNRILDIVKVLEDVNSVSLCTYMKCRWCPTMIVVHSICVVHCFAVMTCMIEYVLMTINFLSLIQ